MALNYRLNWDRVRRKNISYGYAEFVCYAMNVAEDLHES